MTATGILYVCVALAAALTQTGYALYIGVTSRKAVPAVWVLAASALWAAAAALEHASPTMAGKIVADRLQYAGFAFLPVTWMVFCLRYARVVEPLKAPLVAALAAIPLIFFVLALTNEYHGIMWVEPPLLVGDAFRKTRRWGFFVLAGYSYLLLGSGIAVLARLARSRGHVYGRQARALLLAALAPCVAGIVDLLELPVLGALDLTPLALAAAMLIVVYGFARLGFRESVPVAHRTIVETMPDLVLIVDRERRILYRNPAAAARLGQTPRRRQSLSDLSNVLEAATRTALANPDGGADLEIAPRWYHLQVSALKDWRGDEVGYTVVLRDVTTLHAAETRLRELAAEEELERSAREKEVLLRELHHRMRNHLQIISSLLGLQRTHASNETVRDALLGAQTRVLAMAAMHDLLDPQHVGPTATAYLERVARMTMEAYGRPGIELRVDLEPGGLPGGRSTICALILSELVSNALKHAYPGERTGTIHVGLRRAEETWTLSVRDDGVGAPPDLDTETPTTLGLLIVSVLARQLDGAVTLAREGGTEVRVTFR